MDEQFFLMPDCVEKTGCAKAGLGQFFAPFSFASFMAIFFSGYCAPAHLLAKFAIPLSSHGKMPAVIMYESDKNWLFLVEAVASHGQMDSKRIGELEVLPFEAYIRY